MHKYTPPVLNGHKVLYKGKRYWAFEISKEHPYENYEKDCSIIVYDKYCDAVAAWCDSSIDGAYTGYIPYGQGSIEVNGHTVKELVTSVVDWSNWIERAEK